MKGSVEGHVLEPKLRSSFFSTAAELPRGDLGANPLPETVAGKMSHCVGVLQDSESSAGETGLFDL